MGLDRIELTGKRYLRGEFVPPSDKSISHRAVILSSLAKGRSSVKNFLRAEDTLSTVSAFRALGVEIKERGDELLIHGKGIRGLKEPGNVIDCRNSGTTMRLLSGVLAGSSFFSVLSGDDSLRRRPMQRVIAPLREMGAEIWGRDGDKYPPLAIRGGALKPVRYSLPVASAQVKSAILLAGLSAEGETEIVEPLQSRDHTERMLPAFGAEIAVKGLSVKVKGGAELKGRDTIVPGDFSSAAFFMVAALLMKGSELVIRNIGINPTRTGLMNVLKRMGADIAAEHLREISGEPVADIRCRGGNELRAVSIGGDEIPLLIDEFPILCIAATRAEGVTSIAGAGELRVKESDRIKAIATELRKLGADLEEYPDGISIKGKAALRGCEVETYGDHRIAMSLSIAALMAEGTTIINNASCVDISFPGFFEELKRLAKD
ncbi:MAG: 3-phosphoshikimate 1-carboxyvinyltransferase [Nitrospirae bacterium]|nr:3-phosphoshikimate 1-carboxyvinyltransferase [Nitrospirota bacterium]